MIKGLPKAMQLWRVYSLPQWDHAAIETRAAKGKSWPTAQWLSRVAPKRRKQLKGISRIVLRCPPFDLEVGGGRAFLKNDPSVFIDFPKIVHGFKYHTGNSIGGQIIGRGSVIMPRLHLLDNTGKGKPGPAWTVGAQAVEVEVRSGITATDFSKQPPS